MGDNESMSQNLAALSHERGVLAYARVVARYGGWWPAIGLHNSWHRTISSIHLASVFIPTCVPLGPPYTFLINAMVDWQAVAVFLAAATWLATTLLGGPMTLLREWVSRVLLNRSHQCQAICWAHLPMKLVSGGITRAATNTIVWENNNINDDHNLERVLATKAFLGVIDALFATKPIKIERPRYLEEKKNYIRTDGDTLLAFLLSASEFTNSGTSGSDGLTSVLTFRAGAVFGRFHRYQTNGESYLVGRFLSESPTGSNWKIKPDIYGLPKEVLRLIAYGYPPFYRDRITTQSGARVSHPIKTLRGVCRGGWIIAIGLSVHEPFMKYNGRYTSQYREACTRVLKTMEKAIQPSFSSSMQISAFCDIAIRAVRRMNSNESGSGLHGFLSGTDYQERCNENLGVNSLSAEHCLFAMRLFDENREEPLTGADKSELEPILVPVLSAAIEGILKWWQYKNNEGDELPEWLLDDGYRHAPIWIEA